MISPFCDQPAAAFGFLVIPLININPSGLHYLPSVTDGIGSWYFVVHPLVAYVPHLFTTCIDDVARLELHMG